MPALTREKNPKLVTKCNIIIPLDDSFLFVKIFLSSPTQVAIPKHSYISQLTDRQPKYIQNN